MFKKNKKWDIQDEQYEFPYHYIPNIIDKNIFYRTRGLYWSFEYFCYINHIAKIVRKMRPKKVLDVGCGDGRFLNILKKEGLTDLVGVDLSDRAIKFAQAFNDGIIFKNEKLSNVKNSFEVVTVIEVLEHIPDNDVGSFLRGVEEKVSPGGFVIFSVPTKNVKLNKKHYRHYDFELFDNQIKNFNINLDFLRAEYLCKKDFLFDFYNKITFNKFWICEIKLLNKFFWKYYWKRIRNAKSKNGQKLILIYKKRK